MASVQMRPEAFKTLVDIAKVSNVQPTKMVEELIRSKRDEFIQQKKLKDDRW